MTATTEVCNFGAFFDNETRMIIQVRNTWKAVCFNLYNVTKVRWFLSDIQTKSAIHAYVASKLDRNNALLSGIPSILTSQLQRVQNAAARLITKFKKYDHVTPILTELHWLPIQDRIILKILLLTYKSLNNLGPSYLSDLLTFYQAPLNLRSPSDPLTLDPPKTRLKQYGDRSFSVIGLKNGGLKNGMNSHRISRLQSPSRCSNQC